jgi:exopolysaccharide biosynthesis operon protein EpsL
MASLISTFLVATLTVVAALEWQRLAALAALEPGNWALVVAGLIAVCVIARRRATVLTYGNLAVPRFAPRRRHVKHYLTCLAVLLAMPARALDHDTVVPFVEERITNDDNVFRISKEVDPVQRTGSASRSDTYHTTSFGLTVDLPVSRQRLVASLAFNRTRYNRFSSLDFDGRDLRGTLLWQAGDRLRGEFGLTDTYSLASFAEALRTTPDRLEMREEFANSTYLLTPQWRLRAAADRLDQYNSDPAQRFNNVAIDSAEVSLSRVSRAGNSIGLRARVETGQFPYQEPLGAALIDNGYRQYAAGLTLDWMISPASHLVARADQASRHYQQLPQRNFDGQIARVEFTWTPPGNLSLTAVAQRDISPYELIRSSIVLVKGIELRPSWKITPMLDLTADVEWASRRYVADPAQALRLTGARNDHVRSLSALLSCHPASWATLQASLLHENRSSNTEFGGYAAQVFWLSARFTF